MSDPRGNARDAGKMAAWAAGRGWAVLKIVPGTKRPAEKWRGLGYRDPRAVRASWGNGKYAVGILTEPSHLVYDDLDVDHEGNPVGEWSLESLCGGDWGKLPPTFELHSPSGGRGLLWASQNGRGYKTCAGQVADHFDVRGNGGLFVLWDPTQPERYVLDDRDPAPIPEWLSALHPEPGSSSGRIVGTNIGMGRLNAWLTRALRGNGALDPCPHTERFVYELPGKFREGLTHEAMASSLYVLLGDRKIAHKGLSIALDEAQELFFSARKGSPRESEKHEEWHNALMGAVLKKLGPRGMLSEDDPCDLDDVMSGDLGRAVRRAKGSKLLNRYSGSWLKEQKFAPLEFAVPELVPEGLSILAGAPKVGKSVLMLKVGLEVARGGDVFSMKCERRRVFYLALEDLHRRMQKRCFELLGDKNIPEWFEYQLEVRPGKLTATVRAFLDECGDDKPLVLIDTLGKVLEPPTRGETTYDRDYRLVCDLKAQCDEYPGSAIVASHHTRKASADDDWLNLVSGTNAITGAADTILTISRQRGGEGNGILRVTGREVDDYEIAVLLHKPEGWSLDGDDLVEAAGNAAAAKMHNPKLGDRSNELLEFVNDNPNGVRAADVAKELGLTPKDAGTYLNNACKRGDIMKISLGLYGPFKKPKVSKGGNPFGSNSKYDDDDS